MTPSPSWWPFKNTKPVHDVAVNDLAVALAFVEGFRYALGEGGKALRTELRNDALREALQQVDHVVTQRIEEAGRSHIRPLADLQRKQREFQAQRDNTTVPEKRARYEHYLEALGWAITHGD